MNMNIPIRNRGIYTNFSCINIPERKPFIPQKHQTECLNYFTNIIMKRKDLKGMLLFHKLGSGKTCTSLMISDYLLSNNLINHVYILTPGSLRSGWIQEYCTKCGKDSDTLQKKYTFVTYNFSTGKEFSKLNLESSLIIIDEIHNLINGYKNQSTNQTLIINKIKNSNCKLIVLSGTPIYSNIYEIAILIDLLKPSNDPLITFKDKKIITGGFDVLLKDNKDEPRNPTIFKNMLDGIISYFPGAGNKYYPRVQHMPPFYISMSLFQSYNYMMKSYKQEQFGKCRPSQKLQKSKPQLYNQLEALYIMSKKWIPTRAACNFYYPTTLQTILDNNIQNNDGWVTPEMFKDNKLSLLSTKISVLMYNIIMHPNQKHVIFTFFKQKSGVNLLHAMFNNCNIKSLIFSGDLNDERRKQTLKRFNHINNRYANDVQVLLVTEAGSEGITIMEARHFHVLESSPTPVKIQQAIGRVVRFKSHYFLPLEEQLVQVWRYCSVLSHTEPYTVSIETFNKNGEPVQKNTTFPVDTLTSDVILYEQEQKKLKQISSFLNILKISSITTFQEESENVLNNELIHTDKIVLKQPEIYSAEQVEKTFIDLVEKLIPDIKHIQKKSYSSDDEQINILDTDILDLPSDQTLKNSTFDILPSDISLS